MKFKVQTSDWTAGLSAVSTITPSEVDTQGSSGYLCVVRGDRCFLYSEDGKQRCRVSIPVFDVEGEGAFVFPTGSQGDLRYVDGSVEFEAGEEDGANVVWCRREGAGKGGVHKIITFSAAALKSLDAELNKATKASTFPVALLKEALAVTRPYMTDPKDPVATPQFCNAQLFGPDDDKQGDGYMLGCSISRTSYFYSPELAGKPLFVYGPRIPLLLSFLNRSVGTVDVYKSANSTYFMNAAEQVLGWSNQTYTGSAFGFYGLALDRHIFQISRASFEKELRYVRSALPPEKNKAHCSYDHEACTLSFKASNALGGAIEALPIVVTPLRAGDEGCWGAGDLGTKEDIQFTVNLDLLIQLVESTKNPRDVYLGVAQVKKSKQFLFRTIEDYFIDESGKYVENPTAEQKGFACRALRFVPSKQ